MSVAVTFADPQRATRALLADLLAGRAEPFLLDENGEVATVSTWFPDGQTGSPTVPHFQVRYDGTPVVDYPVTERAQIGLVAWYDPGRQSDAKDAASLAAGLLCGFGGNAAIRNIRPATGRLTGVDKATGLYFVTQTLRVLTRASAIA